MTATIDALTRADAAACADLEARLFPADDPWPASAFRHALAAPHNRYYAARHDGALVGYAGIARLGLVAPYEYEVHTIGVAPAHQGRGLGRRLLTALLDVAGEDTVFLEVRTDNEVAQTLYRSVGFDVVGLRRRYYRVSGADAYTMVRAS